jgi:hypothetical protein
MARRQAMTRPSQPFRSSVHWSGIARYRASWRPVPTGPPNDCPSSPGRSANARLARINVRLPAPLPRSRNCRPPKRLYGNLRLSEERDLFSVLLVTG